MKVQVHIKQTVEYVADVEMSKAEFDEWEDRLKAASFHGDSAIAEELLEKYGRQHGCRLGEPSDWGDLTVDTFNPIRKARSTAQRESKP